MSENLQNDLENLFTKYCSFEQKFRGDFADIKKRLEPYLEYLKSVPGPILELGSGRGELQILLKENGLKGRSVDISPLMVELQRQRGIDAVCLDAIEYLESIPDHSIGALVAIQFVEHLSEYEFSSMLRILRKKLFSGGLLLLETINTESIFAFVRHYYRDQSHKNPVHPDTLCFNVENEGFVSVKRIGINPFQKSILFEEFDEGAFKNIEPAMLDFVRCANRNARKLNDILFGSMDYMLLGYNP